MAISILFAVGALAGCDDSGATDGGTSTGGSTTGSSTTGGATTGASTTGGASTGGFMTVNGCTMGMYTDQSGSGTPTVDFPGTITGEYHYVPNCTHISPGQTVTFNGAFGSHPLNPGVAPSVTGSDPSSTPNPIILTNTGTTATFTFPTAGTYGMYCGFHQGFGMYGAIRVQ
jgi:plastocyanin